MKTPVIYRPRPLIFVEVGGGTTGANLVTPNPKEVWTTAANNFHTVTLDLLANPDPWDSGHLGFIRGLAGADVTVRLYRATNSAGPWTLMAAQAYLAQGNDSRPWHFFIRAGATTQDRYAKMELVLSAVRTLTVGVASIGGAWSPVWGIQAGPGRRPIDTGQANRLLDGSWGINPGVVAKAFQCEFADLSDSELLALEAIVDSLGETSSVLLVENPDTAEPGLERRIHWGLFRGLDYFERRIGDSSNRWAFRVEDWAG